MTNQFYVVQIYLGHLREVDDSEKVSKYHNENIHYDTMCHTALKINPAAKEMENAQ